MKLNFDKDRLNKVLQTFHTVTNANVCVFDSDFNEIASYGVFPCFCEQIRKRDDLFQKCLLSDKLYAEECSTNKRSVTYTCHAGIVETISPIFLDGILLGYIIFGGLRDLENEFSNEQTVRAACDLYGLDEEEYLANYNSIPAFDHTQLNAYIYILKLCIKNILTENMLKPNATLFSTQIISYLKENSAEDFKIHGICTHFGITEKTLYKIVRDATGKTVGGYISFLRIENAKLLLSTTDSQISEVAIKVGFNDYNYFIKIFKKLLGVTPLQYKKNHGEQV